MHLSQLTEPAGLAEKFNRIVTSINSMLAAERDYAGSLTPGHYWNKSKYWMEQLFRLGAEWARVHFRDHVRDGLSDGYPGDYSEFANLTVDQIAQHPAVQNFERAIQGLPPKFVLEEPHFDNPKQWGFDWKGRRISFAISRLQRCISNLYRFGVFERIGAEGKPPVVLEIGAGYGLLAFSLLSRLPPGAKYIIIDIPQILSLSATGLAILRPDLRQSLVYKRCDLDAELERADLIFLPHYLLDRLTNIPLLNLALNTMSFQEMAEENIDAYARFLERHLDGVLYSENMRRHPHNYDLKNKVATILGNHLSILPSDDCVYDDLERRGNYMWQTYIHFATARDRPAFRGAPLGNFLGENFQIDIAGANVRWPIN